MEYAPASDAERRRLNPPLSSWQSRIPQTTLTIIVPFYVMMRFLGLINTHFGLMLAYTAFCLPFGLWKLRTFFQSIPLDI